MSKRVKDTKYYEALGVDPSATIEEIKRAYKKLAFKLHPDRNKDADATEKFKEVGTAFEVLADEEKRQLYDQYGEEGLEAGGGGGGGNPFDIFEHFFGGGGGGGGMGGMFGGGGGRGGGRGGRRGPRKGEDVVHALKVTLKELYNGKVSKLALNRSVLCGKCSGKGGVGDNAVESCRSCNGQGVKIAIRQLGPGMIQQMQTVCPECKGQGESIKESKRCKACKGQKTVQEKKVLEVHIDKGMSHGQKITFPGEADEAPDMEPGDIVIVVQQQEHESIKRQKGDLIIEHTISLSEALTGFEFPFTHLDDRVLVIKSVEGEIIKPGQLMKVCNEGMPTYKRPFDKGDLYVKFAVDFPTSGSIPVDICQKLEALLPPKPEYSYDQETAEECVMMDAGLRGQQGGRRSGGGGGAAYHEDAMDEDDEEGGGRGGVQCHQQ